ncbi:hypothetical protein PC9H_003977 [Pleurotus ostreatus]|uniref:Uncharacterized protein n=1 Tax=Pleurotus ostreatus TaxID=5322 RepID=A0A8H7A3C5_PLEOS|nr:uncharacterized protein PC9H_003977 [Pleurotus ostreatus]KAF7437141.1 hypothetical protein PC9H_003977 [Pleurotus ostreatus]KAJ8703011.1 hypothetical protein PTI98_001670 [Pleurotus ostreatus]
MPPTIRRFAIAWILIFCSVTVFFTLIFFYHHHEWRTLGLTGISDDAQNYVQSSDVDTHHAQSSHPAKVLIVSAFYPLSKSKHPIENYKAWLNRFLQNIESPVYFFTTPAMEGLIRGCRANHPIYINTTFERAFDVPPLHGLEGEYEKMQAKDREGFRHSPELYSVWNAKPYFLDEAVRNVNSLDPFAQNAPSLPTYNYGFWVDAGSFRQEHFYQRWPDAQRVQEVFEEGSQLTGTPQDELIFFPICTIPERGWKRWRESDGPVDFDFSEGSFFGGSPKAISWYAQTFYAQHDKYLANGIFVGKDQTVINAIMFLHANKFVSVWVGQPPYLLDPHPSLPPPSSPSPPLASDSDTSTAMTPLQRPRIYPPLSRIFLPLLSVPQTYCGPEWYHYEFFLASPSERSSMLALWGNIRDSRMRGAWWGRRGWNIASLPSSMRMEPTRKDSGGGDESVCPMKELMSIESLLKTQFGERWVPIRME